LAPCTPKKQTQKQPENRTWQTAQRKRDFADYGKRPDNKETQNTKQADHQIFENSPFFLANDCSTYIPP
jgi:hypothetical protein